MPTYRVFLETAQVKIHQLIPFSFFRKQLRLFNFVLSHKNNLIVCDIKYTYLSLSVRLSEWTFQDSIRALLNGREWKFVERLICFTDFCLTR